jgi:2-oxoglutarate ferredoxin oxidoreductase subunit beta
VARSVDVFATHLSRAAVAAAAPPRARRSSRSTRTATSSTTARSTTSFTDRGVRDEKVLYLEPGKKLLWGKEQRMGLVQRGFGGLAAIPITGPEDEARVLVHDPSDRTLALALAQLDPTRGDPVPVGLFYAEQRPTYDALFQDQLAQATAKKGLGDLQALLDEGDTWVVGG